MKKILWEVWCCWTFLMGITSGRHNSLEHRETGTVGNIVKCVNKKQLSSGTWSWSLYWEIILQQIFINILLCQYNLPDTGTGMSNDGVTNDAPTDPTDHTGAWPLLWSLHPDKDLLWSRFLTRVLSLVAAEWIIMNKMRNDNEYSRATAEGVYF